MSEFNIKLCDVNFALIEIFYIKPRNKYNRR